MSAHDDGGPAFPHIDSGCGRFDAGMTLRDYFAVKALPVVASGAHEVGSKFLSPKHYDTAARYAYELADAMLKARNA